MNSSSIIKVPIPQKGITKVKSGISQITYVYYYTEIFRNENGKPDNKRVSIGRYLEKENMLIPNKNYYKIFEADMIQDEIDSLDISEILRIGEFVLFDKIANELGLIDTIKNVFKNNADEILTTTMYMLCNNKASMYLENWCADNYSYVSLPITQSSRIYKEIDYNKRFDFFKQWIEINNPDEYNAYDITSISSYCTNSDLTEYGYNRDGENLAQMNLGVVFGEISKLPKYYNCYSGSINDKTYLPYMTEGIDELDIKISRFVLDRGFISETNINHMLTNDLHFIICAKETSKVKENVIKNIEDVKNPENYILEHETYGKSYSFNDRVNIHIYFDNNKLSSIEKDFYAKINMHEKELSKLLFLDNKSAIKYRQYFNIVTNKDKSFTYKKDIDKIKDAHKLIGYFACLTNEKELTSEDVIEIYRRKDSVEKHFDNHKHFNDGKRLRTHNDLTGQGKTFILFLSLIFKSYIDKMLENQTKINKNKKVTLSVDKILLELSKIKIIRINKRTRLVQPITKKQREILKWFKISEEDIFKFVKNV